MSGYGFNPSDVAQIRQRIISSILERSDDEKPIIERRREAEKRADYCLDPLKPLVDFMRFRDGLKPALNPLICPYPLEVTVYVGRQRHTVAAELVENTVVARLTLEPSELFKPAIAEIEGRIDPPDRVLHEFSEVVELRGMELVYFRDSEAFRCGVLGELGVRLSVAANKKLSEIA